MSAFIVRDETINRVVSYLYIKAMNGGSTSMADELKEAGYDLVHDQDAGQRLAGDMLDLNVQATIARYGEGRAGSPALTVYRQHRAIGEIQAYKSLRCWLYQCGEGSVPEADLFQTMQRVVDLMAHEIVRNTPEYGRAEWD